MDRAALLQSCCLPPCFFQLLVAKRKPAALPQSPSSSEPDESLSSEDAPDVTQEPVSPCQAPSTRPVKDITIECYGLGGQRADLVMRSDSTAAQVLERLSRAKGVPCEQLSVFLGDERLERSGWRLFSQSDADSHVLHFLMSSPQAPVELHFDSLDLGNWWSKLEAQDGRCVLDVHAGCCHGRNLRYWQSFGELLSAHGHRVSGIKLRQRSGYLHPDAVHMLGAMLPSNLESLDLSFSLFGATGVRSLTPYLPSKLKELVLARCLGDFEAFGNGHIKSRWANEFESFGAALVTLLTRHTALQELSISEKWAEAELRGASIYHILQKVSAAASPTCLVSFD